MDKALGFEPRDCGFESRHDLLSTYILALFLLDLYTYLWILKRSLYSLYDM